MSHTRNCLDERILRPLIGLVPLCRVNYTSARCDVYAKFSTLCRTPLGQFEEQRRLSDLEAVINKFHAGTDENGILNSLMNDDTCSAINLSHTLVNTLLHRFEDDWKSALGIYRWAELCPCFEHLPETCDLIVDILGKVRQFDKMRELVCEMHERKLVTLKTVAKMMRRFCGARRWNDAVRTFDELETFGLEKSTESMNLLFDTLCKEKQVEIAREIFLELKSHIAPSAHTFNIFIHGWCKIKRVEEARWTLQEMKGYGFPPSVISYSTIIQSYCQQSSWSNVYELLEVMRAQGCHPTIVTYTTIMGSLAKAEDLEGALQIPVRVRLAGCKPDTLFYNALIHTLGKAQRIWEALDVFKVEMPNNGVVPNVSTYNTLIAMFCHHGQDQMAFNILKEIEMSAVCKLDMQTFYPLLKACFKLGTVDSCLKKLLDDMATKYHLSLDVSTYTLLIHGLCRVGKCEWAFHLFEEMIGKGLIARYPTCRLLLDEFKQKSMHDAFERVELYLKELKASRRLAFPGSYVRSAF